MIPHLCHIFPGFGTGGTEVRTARLINALGDAYRHTVIALDRNFTGCQRLATPATVRCVPGPARRGRLSLPVKLAGLLRSLAPDCVLTYSWGGTDGILAARLAGLSRVLHAEDGFSPIETHGQNWARRLARRVLFRLAVGVVVPSRVLADICAHSWKLPSAKVRYVPNGIDLTRFAPPSAAETATARLRFGLPADAVVVGTVGRFSAEKNQGRLLRAFAVTGNRSARLLLVGEGPLRSDLEQQARAAGLAERIHFTGVVTDPRDCYRAMDVFALSSDTEQMPLVVLEAMATGLPVVSTAVGDVSHMVAAANQHLVVPARDESGYAARLAGLLEDPAARCAVGAANRQECRRFDVDTMINSYRSLYDDVLARI